MKLAELNDQTKGFVMNEFWERFKRGFNEDHVRFFAPVILLWRWTMNKPLNQGRYRITNR